MKKWNRIISLLLACAMLAGWFPATTLYAHATEEEEMHIHEETLAQEENAASAEEAAIAEKASAATSGTCGTNLTWTLDEDGTLTISGTGEMDDYSSFSAPWYSYADNIQKIVMEDGVTSIGDYAFSWIRFCTEVRIPDSVISMGDSVFLNSYIGNVSIGSGVTNIDSYTFSFAELGSVEVAADNTAYCCVDGVLFNAAKTKLIKAPMMGGSYTVPDTVTSIERFAFYRSPLTSVEIGSSVTYMGTQAFAESGLTGIKFLGNAPSGGGDAFSGVIATAYYPAGNPTWTADVMNTYNGEITWIAYDPCNGDHSYGADDVCTVCGAAKLIPTVATTDELVTELRKAMVQRQEHIELRLNGVTLTSSDVSSLFLQARAHTGVPNEGDYIRANMVGYSTSLTTGSDENGVYSIVTVDCDFISDAAMEAEVDAAVEELLNELDLWDASNYEKVKGAYDWITENVAYDYAWDDLEDDTGHYEHTTHAALIAKNAVCQGFASLYYRLMLELGVDCRYISGISTDIESSERHAWNIVYLEGKYYNCDPTWDRSLMGHYRYFLCTQANFAEHDRDAEFETAAFHAQYPMAVTPYVQNVTASGQINANLAWVLDGDTGTLTVAGTGAIPSYRFSYAPWYNYRESVRKIVVSEGITEVGERAFYWCTNCTEVQLPDSLTAIREYGFNNLRALRTITLPPNLEIIEFCGFSECVALTSITLPDSVTTVGSSAFSNCPSLTSAVLSDGMTTIPNSMFFNDTNLQNVTLPSGVTYIGSTAFHSTGLRSITIPATLTSMGDSVFASCGYLSAFTVEEGNPSYKTVDGVLFSADGTHLICYPSAKYGNYTVPEGTKYIDYGAFRSARYLYRVYFPSTLIEIGGYSFSYCSNLSSITLNSNILTVEEDAFRSCTSLYSVTFENPNVDLVGYTFANCTSLRSITLPANIQQIPNGLFYGCTNLQSITIPRTATKIGSSAFLDCDGLTTITIPGTVKAIGQQAFDFCNKLETITFEEGVQKLGFICIRNAPRLKKVVIPRTVTTIEQPTNTDSYMFDGCPNVVLYVECETYAYSYAVRRGLQYQMSHAIYTADVVSPTCTEQGYTHYCCPCGFYDYFANYVSALGHNYTSVTVNPTCTEDGYTRYTCTRCGHTYDADPVSAAHAYGPWYTVIEVACTENGSERRDCDNCDHYETREVAATGHYVLQTSTELVDPYCTENDPNYPFAMQNGWYTSTNHAHNSSSAFIIRALYDCEFTLEYKTSSESGYDKLYVYVNGVQRDMISGISDTKTLSTELKVGDEIRITYSKDYSVNVGDDCGYFRITNCPQVELEGNVHVSTDDLQPTCEEAVVCDGCGQTIKPAVGHDYSTVVTAPTCTAQGFTTHTCANCGESYVDSYVNATGHTYGNWRVTKAATCLEAGTEQRDCQNCDHYEIREVAAIGHNYNNVVTAPTCTERGYTTHTCANCANRYVDSYVDALGHTFQNYVSDENATCTVDGTKTAKCERCDVTDTVTDEGSAKGHAYGNWRVTKAATCLEAGTEQRDCQNCDHYETREVAAIGHNYSAVVTAPTCTDRGYTTHTCANCSNSYVDAYVNATGHTYGDWTTTQAPTCTANGSEQRDCQNCDHYESRVIPYTGHAYEDTVVAPTCTAGGYTTHLCTVCGNRYTDQRVDALGHSFRVYISDGNATCTVDGTKSSKCERCDVTDTVADPGSAIGHTYGEWTVTQVPTCLEKGTEQRDCRNCDHSETREIAATGHNYNNVVTAPTCTDRGYTTHTCVNCGNSYVDTYVNALGHEWDEGVVTIEPTEETEGQRKYTCRRCNETKTEIIPTLDHVHSYTAVVTAPTCTEQGYTTHTCRCGDSYVDTYVNATGHIYGGWTVTEEPTCLEAGTERRDCANCDRYETREVAATGHNYNNVVTAPTCTDRGYTTHTCENCSNSYVDSYVVATGHTYGDWTATEGPTCLEKGSERRDCVNCDHYETREVAAIGHNYSNVVTAPTCTDRGYTTHTCANCGNSYVDSYVAATGHTYGSWIVTQAPTCTSKGTERRDCQNCDHFETREVAATGHNYNNVVTAPACTDRGYTTHTCANCGNSYVDSYVNALGHDWDDGVVTVEPTEETEGQRKYTCQRCGETRTEVIPTLDHVHSYTAVVTAPTCTEQGYTTHTCRCGDSYVDTYVNATDHAYGNWTVTEEPTCLENGSERRDCENCDHYETREIAATGHSYNNVVTAPTCTDRGYTTHTCANCGNSYVDSYVNATGHTYGDWTVTQAPACLEKGSERRDCDNCDHYETREIAATGHDYKTVVTAPSCTDRGYTTHTCANCGNSYVDSYVNALGHDWDSGIVTIEPTEETEGQRKYTCQRCNETRTEVIPTLDHVHSYTAVVTAPTCTEQGYTTHTCRCGDSYVDTYVNATGHTYGDWIVTQTPTCLEKGSERRDCVNCDHYETREIAAIGHNYSTVVTAPTCTDRGYTTHTCSNCGNSYVDSYVAATGHIYGSWTVTEEPTCLEAGTERRNCANCDHYEIREVAAIGHNYSNVVTAPTCADRGYTTHTCVSCGDSYVDSYVAATGHAYGSWTVTEEPTCLEKGTEQRDCQNCDHYETRDVAATGHSYNNVVTAPTCTAQGYTTHTCANCGNSYVDMPVAALGHAYGEWYEVKPAALEEEGEERRDCDRCDDFQTRKIPMLTHNYTSVITAPTCTAQGYTTHTCTNCGDSYVDTYVNALGHNFQNYVSDENATCTVDGTKTAKCEHCDVTDTVTEVGSAKGHTYGNWTVIEEPTCLEKGSERRDCDNCDHFETREIAATGHNYSTVVTAPTCTDRGYTTHTCANCGDSYVDSYVNALGHDWDSGIVTIEPTEENEGQRKYTCQRCGETRTEVIPTLDHVHSYTATVTPPTCTEQGYTTHTCRCGNSYVDTYVNATGHTYGDWIVTQTPTCLEKGSERRDCQNCDYYEIRAVAAIGHNYSTVVTAPTCTDRGYTTYTCANCGDSYVDSYVNALGHDWDSGIVTIEPTEETEGQRKYTCQRCGETRTESIPALEHTHNYVPAVTPPTCTEQGYTTHTCACGSSYVDSYVDAIGHDYQSVVTPPTTESQGYTTHTCQNCGDSYTDSYVPALGSVAIIGETRFETVSEALAVAREGDVIQLTADANESGNTLIVRPGVTLNLGAYDLIADGFIGFNGSYLNATRYSATGDYGKLIVPKENLVLTGGTAVENGEYDVIPVWNGEDAYVLANAMINDTDAGYGLKIDEEAKTISFSFAHKAGGSANKAFFLNGTGDNAMKIIIRLEWASGNGVAYQDFVYNDDFVGKVSQGGYNYSFVLNNYDILNIDISNLKVTAMIITDSGTITAGSIWTQGNANN